MLFETRESRAIYNDYDINARARHYWCQFDASEIVFDLFVALSDNTRQVLSRLANIALAILCYNCFSLQDIDSQCHRDRHVYCNQYVIVFSLTRFSSRVVNFNNSLKIFLNFVNKKKKKSFLIIVIFSSNWWLLINNS